MHLYLVAAGPAESDRRAGAVARGAGRVTRLSREAEPGTELDLSPLYSVHVYMCTVELHLGVRSAVRLLLPPIFPVSVTPAEVRFQ